MKPLTDLLRIERNPEILGFRFEFDGMLMWPHIRAFVLEKWISDIYEWPVQVGRKRVRRSVPEKVSYFANMIRKRPEGKNLIPDTDILIFTGGISNFRKDRCYFNKVVDYFALEYPEDTLVIEDSWDEVFLTPRCHKNVLYRDIVNLRAYLAVNTRRVNPKDIRIIESFVDYLKNSLNVPLDASCWNTIKNNLLHLSVSLPVYHTFYNSIFDRCRPKIMLVEDGCYGAKSYIFKWGKNRGILSAEHQHGTIYENHYAYNYGAAVLESKEYRAHFPDFFLAYGSYWNTKTNIPSEKVVIGNPHYRERLNTIERTKTGVPGKNVILITSSSTNPGRVVRFAKSLLEIVDRDAFRILFRPHPSERPLMHERYGEILDSDGIELDEEPDVYVSLARARFLVSEPSTVVYEAIGLCDRIFILDVPSAGFYFPGSPFPVVANPGDLFTAPGARDDRSGSGPLPPESIWSRDWRRNYRNFIDPLITRR